MTGEQGLPAAASRGDGPGERFDALYPAFQDRFRGSAEQVRDRLSIYLADVAGADTGRGVLDVGPGRGEWLGMLAEQGFAGYGVDASAGMAALMRAQGLSVVHADAATHLHQLAPGCLDAVTAFHVIEHVRLDALLDLLAAARHALRPGGLLILETPDPTNLVMGACNFRLDPTHRHPLPPALTEFLVDGTGFTEVEIRRLHPKEEVDLSGLRLTGVDDRTSALLASALAQAFFGPQDYAVLARTPAEQPETPGRP